MFKIFCVTNRRLCREDFFARLERIAESSVSGIILREKDLNEREYLELAQKAVRVCKENRDKLILHSYMGVAKALKIDKIHLPLPVFENNYEQAEDFKTVGTSIHSPEQLRQAESLGAGYVTAGHIFATDCKKGLAPRGVEFLQRVCDVSKIPVYAIGGINLKTIPRLAEVKSPMFKGVCIMSEFMTCNTPEVLAEDITEMLNKI